MKVREEEVTPPRAVRGGNVVGVAPNARRGVCEAYCSKLAPFAAARVRGEAQQTGQPCGS